MDGKLITQLKILKLTNSKPNFSEFGRIYGVDRRTVKKYYDGYEGKPKHRLKPSILDKHVELIKEKLLIKGTTTRSVYEFILSEVDSEIGSYSNFNKYIKSKGIKTMKTAKEHPRFETPAGLQAQVDWKEDISIANKYGEIFTFQVFDYKLGHSRYCQFTYKNNKTRQDVFDCLIASFIATGGVPPLLLFQKEKEYLQSLPNQKVIKSYLNHNRQITVKKDSLITYRNSKYSVPSAYIGKSVHIRETENKLYIYYNTECIAVHNLSEQRINYVKEHYTELLSHLIDDKATISSIAEENLRQMDIFL